MQNITEEQARKKVEKIKKFYTHSIIFGVALLIFILKTYFGAPLNFFPFRYLSYSVIGIWSLIYFVDLVKFIILDNNLGSNWEQKKIEELMKKDNSKKWE